MFDVYGKFKEIINKAVAEFVKEIIDAAFEFLKIFMLKPTDFERFTHIDNLQGWVLGASLSVAVLFFIFQLMKLLTQQMGGFANRSAKEIVTKTILATVFAMFTPFLLTDILIAVNNAWVNFILSKGIDVDTLAKMFTIPATMGLASMCIMIFYTLLYLILAFQYIIRSGELMILFIFSSIAAISSINEDLNIFPVWWREAIATVFQQSLQITILWAIMNQLAGGRKLLDYIIATGLMFGLIIGPKFLRRLIYSTGTGRSAVSAAGSAGKMAMYKFAAKKMIK